MTQTPAITLTGDLAEWLIERAERNTRTPEQELTHILMPFRQRAERARERRKQREVWKAVRRRPPPSAMPD
ncbi:MAG: hypothetical protein KDI15_13710 [Thiothrix sp.]|nr:hypothetical protein [Thiothrix sp.]HPE62420.1 hypothetical protein [Thiolinea sp.]